MLQDKLPQLVSSKKEQFCERGKWGVNPIYNLTVEEIKTAEKEIIKAVQVVASPNEMATLKPQLEEENNGNYMHGGQIKWGKFMEDERFPVILPRAMLPT